MLLLAPLALFAAPTTIQFRGQDISYEGAKIEWVGDPTAGDSELILIYTNCAPDAVNTFEPSRAATARVLAIGGGGAGGTVRSGALNYSTHAGGGGGGAGEFLDRVGVPFAAEKVGILVGLGGAATGVSGKASAGENGKPSAITNLTATLILVNGGGGGGGESAGSDGGSGGGASYASSTAYPGGSSNKNESDSFGFGGGSGVNRVGAGGGGAGKAGGVGVVDGAVGTGGTGGNGRSSDIRLDSEGNPRWYAGGGGGGLTIQGTVGAGGGSDDGKIILGGHGATVQALTVATAAPTSGEPFTGSGGGGGGRYWPGAAGGSGIVIIRLTGIEQPKIWKAVPISRGGFDGYIFIDSNAEEPKTLGTGDAAELVLTYTDPYNGGGLSFTLRADMELIPEQEAERAKYSVQIPIWANARILAVGGGGGGGMMSERTRGAGAGGGAGGFVEAKDLVFNTNEVYSIAVGKGGKGGERNEGPGENGGDSSVSAGTTVFGAVARGGGGGGATTIGGSGGSGGGGSYGKVNDPELGGWSRAGGEGVEGQGNKGGIGQNTNAGGGGGGAGSEGGATAPGVAGAGGKGKSCDISGEVKWYAGGGGGAFINTSDPGYDRYLGGAGGTSDDGTIILGGRGAGVDGGATGQELNPVPATDGVVNTGSGGGGGVSYKDAPEKAGDGGHGIVIIRLSGIIVRAVPLPKPQGPFTYDGNAHTGVVEFYAYTLTGTPVATNADWYTVTATMEPGASYTWADWHEGDPEEKKWGPRDVSWCINQMRVPQPAAVSSRVYNGEEQYPVDKDGLHLDDDGYCYTDEGLKYCFLTATHKATDAAAYHFTAQLVADYASTPNVTNFVWAAAEGSGSTGGMDDKPYTWEITQAPNKIIWTSPYLGYLRSRLDTPAKPHHPLKHVKSAWGLGGATVEYKPIDAEEGWQAWPPPAKGNYELRITIEETPNWQGDSVTADFGTWDRLADLYSDQMDVKVSGNTSGNTELKDFPVPVRVREPKKDGYAPFSGFSYGRAGATGKELHFFDSSGDPIEHEVDTWNTHGESILWVRVPVLKSTTTTLTMCWRRVGDIRIPAYDPAGVWRQYEGVWHFSQEERGVWADSSGNDRHAHLTAGGKVRPIDGKLGKALYVQNGDLLADGWPYPAGVMSNRFSYSGWYKYPDFVADGQVTGGNKMFAGVKLGATTTAEMKTLPGWCLRMNNNAAKVVWETTGQDRSQDTYNLQTTMGFLAYVGGYGSNFLGSKREYMKADGTIVQNQLTATDIINGSSEPLQLATGGFEVDEVRFATNATVLADAWIKEEFNSVKATYDEVNNKDYCTYGFVRIDCDKYNSGNGLICDWWSTVPSIDAKKVDNIPVWHEHETATAARGVYKSAASAISATYRLIPDGDPATLPSDNKFPTTLPAGHYRATFDHSSPATYRPQPHTIDFYIIEATVPVYDIGGNGGDSGRILLMNADNNAKASVTNQGWCAQSDTGVTYWRKLAGGEGTNNVMPWMSSELVRSADTNVLWRLYDCRQGNTFPTNDTGTGSALSADLCYLPASSETALSITNEDVKAGRADTGWVLMRNLAGSTDDDGGACVYSPCYTNGIGTIYFDAVNGRKAQGDRAEAFKIVLEIATETQTGLPPVDSNCWYEVSGVTNWYGNLEGMWREVEMSPMFVSSSTYTDQPATNCLALKVTQGGKVDQFYRVHAFVDVHKPVRFRIRRVSRDETVPGPDGQPDPDDGYILLDNIIASFPPVVAELTPYGSFDATLDGARAVGYGGAFETPFPSAAEGASLTGRCAVAFTDGYEPPPESFSLKQMFYRWRYLEQLKEPTDGDWAATDLTEAGGELRTAQPLETPAEAGDIEFYFVTVLKAPYYGYVDYSGNRPVSKSGYTEEGLPHESRFKSPDGRRLASGGTDWFVRIRDGRSRYEGVRLLTRPADGGPVETNVFELAGDDQWTAKLRTRNPVRGGLDFRIEGLNPQTPGAREYAFSTDFWKTDNRIETFPSREGLSVCGADDWGWVACDGATGFLYFQLDLEKKAVQVAHAQAEDFSKWSSAINENGLFVGSAVDTNASSAVTVEYDAEMAGWPASEAGNESWNETFTGAVGEWNEPFSTARSPHGWTVESAAWTYGKWSQQATASTTIAVGDEAAAQLMGLGQGRVSFIDASKVPDGLDTVTYRARVGQVNEFTDFCRYDWYLGTSFDDMVPTRLMTDYTVATIAALTETGKDAYDGDGSVSLVGYYNSDFGCYEFRVSRGSKETDLRLALFRWRKSGGGYVCQKLLDKAATDTTAKNFFDYNNKDATGKGCCADRLVKTSRTLYGGLFLSVMEDNGKTLVTAGVCETDVSTQMGSETMSGQSFTCLTYHDSSAERLTKGTFGLMSCNCPGLFAKPVCYRAGVSSYKPTAVDRLQSAAGKTVTFIGDKITGSATDAYYTRWEKGGRLVRATGHDWWGFQAATPEAQTVKVQVSEHGASNWQDVYVNTVNGFTDREFRNVIHDPRQCDVRLQVGDAPSSARTDVIVNEVSITQWNGQWTEHWNESAAPWRNLTNAFVYTSAWVLDRSGRKSLNLQPTRAQTASTPVSLRSPLMRGLGLVHFAWRNADPHAKVRVQYKQNVSYISLPDATKTLSSGATEIGDGWVDWKDENGNAAIDVGAIGESGSMSVYLDKRYDKTGSDRNYLFGLIRVVIDEDVQAEAMAKRRTDPLYGAVEITDMFTWDFPEYDKDGWQGWNFRAAGWNGTDPDAFANLKDSFRGLSGLLNNTLDPDTLADREKDHYSQRSPSVQSPAFRTNCVGALSFRARLYDADDQRLSGHPAVVSVYGCNNFDPKSGEPKGDWNWICDVEVSNRTYAIQSVKIPATLDCKAIRLAVKGVKGVKGGGDPPFDPDPPLRVALDDIVIWERLSQSVAFRKAYVRPFRDAMAIKGKEVVPDIAERTEQPLIGESFGFQAEVDVLDPDEVITGDPEHPVTVDLWYYAPKPGEPTVWGFENWKNSPSAVKVPVLAEATDRGDRLIFRSTVEQSASLCPPQFLEKGEGYRIVQYHVTAHYFVQGYSEGVHELQSSEWSMPEWNTGFTDPNTTNTAFSAFTLLEEIAPGRAWINEINYCEPTKDASLRNQWIELAVPSGVDMTGWSVDVYNYEGNWVSTLVTLGLKDAPASKRYGGTDPVALASHYAFYTVKSPDTTAIAADATWPRFGGTGSFAYTEPYAFELKRPTGVVEHRVVAQGYNDVKGKKWYWTDYEGTNLVEVMRRKDGSAWTWSAEDLHDASAANCSVSVVTNQGFAHADWVSPLAMTPGDINRGQYIDPKWWIDPNGGYVKIYSTVLSTALGTHMRQIIGGVTNLAGDLTVSQGTSTSIVYEVDRWYKLGKKSVDPDERATWSGPQSPGADGKLYYRLDLNQVSNSITVTVSADVADEVTELIDEKNREKYAAYIPAIMKWLTDGETGWDDAGHHKFMNPNGPLKVGYYRGHMLDNPLPDGEDNRLDLLHLYWFDLDPTSGGWELWGGMGAYPLSTSELPVDDTVLRTKELYGGGEFIHTNHLTSFWMELRNTVLNAPAGLSYPPYRLQGLGNERSDDSEFSGSWTSATFKVTMCLNNGKVDWQFHPMRYFVFGPGSFHSPKDPETTTPYSAVVEITDPFSDQSPAAEWGWKKYESEDMRENGLFTRWRIDGAITPGGVSTLKKNDLLEF